LEILLQILESFLNQSKNGIDERGQAQFDCPHCSVNEEHSYKCEVNFYKGIFRCWRCCETDGTHGTITKLIKEYGSPEILQKYKNAVKEIKASREYELDLFSGNGIAFEVDEEDKIMFVDHTYDFQFNGLKREQNALEYLLQRGFDENQIKKYGLKYTTYDCKDKRWWNRIIIPSYNKYNELDYYTGRDYTGKSKQKYLNCDYERRDIIFNESLINWDSDVCLLEGPLDSTSIPNSIPLMGKSLNPGCYLFDCLLKFSSADIIVFLDNDATEDCKAICRKLCNAGLGERLKYVPTEELRLKLYDAYKKRGIDLKKLDPSKLFEIGNYKGICWALKNSKDFECL